MMTASTSARPMAARQSLVCFSSRPGRGLRAAITPGSCPSRFKAGRYTAAPWPAPRMAKRMAIPLSLHDMGFGQGDDELAAEILAPKILYQLAGNMPGKQQRIFGLILEKDFF